MSVTRSTPPRNPSCVPVPVIRAHLFERLEAEVLRSDIQTSYTREVKFHELPIKGSPHRFNDGRHRARGVRWSCPEKGCRAIPHRLPQLDARENNGDLRQPASPI